MNYETFCAIQATGRDSRSVTLPSADFAQLAREAFGADNDWYDETYAIKADLAMRRAMAEGVFRITTPEDVITIRLEGHSVKPKRIVGDKEIAKVARDGRFMSVRRYPRDWRTNHPAPFAVEVRLQSGPTQCYGETLEDAFSEAYDWLIKEGGNWP